MKEYNVTSLAGLVGFYHGYIKSYKHELEWISKDVKSNELKAVIQKLETLLDDGDAIWESIIRSK